MSFNFDAKIFVNIGGTGLGTYVWAEAISLFSVQRAELIADDETESVFAGAAAPRVAVDDLVDPDGRYIFLNLKNLGQVWVLNIWVWFGKLL